MTELPDPQSLLSHGFDRALTGVRVESMHEGKARLSLVVTDSLLNPVRTLHGGAIATLVDDAGTLAIMSADAHGRAGVTTDLNVSYLSAARPGETITIEATALRTGRTLAFVTVDLRNAEGKLLAHGRMTKYMGNAGSS